MVQGGDPESSSGFKRASENLCNNEELEGQISHQHSINQDVMIQRLAHFQQRQMTGLEFAKHYLAF